MKRVIWILVGLIAFTSCKKKEIDMTVMTKTLFEGVDFTEIIVSDAWNASFVQDDQNTCVELEYSAFLENYLDVRQSGKTISIGNNTYYNLPHNTVRNAVIHVKKLEKLHAKEASICRGGLFTGNVDIILEEASHLVDCNIETSYCEIQLNDVSSLKGNLTADSTNLTMDNAARMITFGGQVQRLRLTMDHASVLNMVNTPVEEVFVTLNEASEATLRVNAILQGTLRNASRLYYKGNLQPEVDYDESSNIQKLTTKN